jgi:Bacterial HORMA domain family 1
MLAGCFGPFLSGINHVTFSYTKTATFSIVHARYLASKVAADMNLCAHYYGKPSEQRIREYAEELARYLSAGYLEEYEFGFQKDGKRVVTWRYRVDSKGDLATDDRPGKVLPYADIVGAVFFNFLTRNSRFSRLSPDERAQFQAELPIQRTDGEPPSDGSGYWVSDRNYFSGGCGLSRRTFRPFP